MDNISLIERIPSVQEYHTLRSAVGWKIMNEEASKKGLNGSLFCICADLDGKIIGMARVIGDSGLYFYIQYVIVLPEHQKMGIGKLLMGKVMDFLKRYLSPLATVGLMSSNGKEPFYEKYGFVKRPSERRGHGMFRIWE